MSKPAARMGDMTAHGGVITLGQPNVLIGGKPAARATDMHTCPMSDGPKPHVGGPIAMGSAGVLIGGMPAARMGDMATCAGPPDTIVMGEPTVLIGEVGSGSAGGGGGGGGGGAAAGAQASAATAQFDGNEATTKEEHWVTFEFVDAAGLPVAGVPYAFEDPDGTVSEGTLRMDGTLRRDALSEGQCEVVLKGVYGAAWEKEEARPDEEVAFSAKVDGFEDGTPAIVQVCKRDVTGPDVVVDEIETEVQGGEIEGKWTFVYPDDQNDDDDEGFSGGYSSPQYYFDVIVERCRARSGEVVYKDYIEIELRDENGDPIPGEKYVVYLSNGEVRKGTLDASGAARVEAVPPNVGDVRFPDVGRVRRLGKKPE